MRKVIDIEERIPSMREKRRKKANRKFFFVVGLFVIALLTVLYFQSSLSKIDQVKVKGAYLYDEKDYLQRSGVESGDKLWGFTKSNVKNKLEEMDGVQKVVVARKWFRDVAISIIEQRPIAYLEIEDKYGILLDNGEVLQPEELVIEENAPVLNGFTNTDLQKQVTTQLTSMENDVYQLISEIIYTGTEEMPDSITVYMNDGYEIKALLPTFADKMDYYSEIVAQLANEEKGVIDMEVGTFFTPYSQVYGVEEQIEEGGEEAESE